MSNSELTRAEKRAMVAQRAGGCCEYCLSQAKFSPDPFSIEHIMPRARERHAPMPNAMPQCVAINAAPINGNQWQSMPPQCQSMPPNQCRPNANAMPRRCHAAAMPINVEPMRARQERIG